MLNAGVHSIAAASSSEVQSVRLAAFLAVCTNRSLAINVFVVTIRYVYVTLLPRQVQLQFDSAYSL